VFNIWKQEKTDFILDLIIYTAGRDNHDDCVTRSRAWCVGNYLSVAEREREREILSSVKWYRIVHPGISPWLVSRARIRQEYVLSRQRINYRESRARRARRKKVKEEEESGAGRKEKRLVARDVGWTLFDGHLLLVAHQRISTSPLCNVHSRPTTLFLSSPLFLLLLLRSGPFVAHAILLPPPPPACHCTCLLGYLVFLSCTRKWEGLLALEKAVKETKEKWQVRNLYEI